MAKNDQAKGETLRIRVKPEDRALIDRASKACGKVRTAFVLDTLRAAAEETLLDRTLFLVSPEAFAEFVARLDEPARPNEGLRKLMRAPSLWK